MSKADKMFKEMGYEKEETRKSIVYKLRLGWKSKIVIDKEHKEYYAHAYIDNENIVSDVVSLCVEEHLAINEKMKELGWIK